MSSTEKFFSNNVAVPKEEFKKNLEKLNYQKKLIKDIEQKHKDWSASLLWEKFLNLINIPRLLSLHFIDNKRAI